MNMKINANKRFTVPQIRVAILILVVIIVAVAAVFVWRAVKPTSAIPVPDYWPTTGWRTSTPEAQGIYSDRLAEGLLAIRKQNIQIHSLLVIRNGYVVTDAAFYPYDGKTVHNVAPVTKSLMKSIITLIAGTLAAIVLFSLGISVASRRMILAPVNRLCVAIAKVSKGDLSQKLEAGSNDEIGALTTSLNGMVENLNQMVREVNRTSDELNAITGDISDVSGKVVNAAQLQSDGVDSTSSAVTEISASIKGVNQHVAGLSATAAETSSSILEMTATSSEVADNLGDRTGIFAQYDAGAAGDDHFVVFRVPAAEKQSSAFLGTLARTGTATVVAP